jgi:DNA (cytosine-5)-methyltransferase 1
MRHTWYEFFAGGGMARLGLGERSWHCTFANDICEKKAAAYRAAFKATAELKVGDIATLSTKDLPGLPSLAWASFPCQDLSLAGAGAGLDGARSGTFKPFWRLIEQLAQEGRAPCVIVLENVTGAITSHDGKDFQTILECMVRSGYRPGALAVDASYFLPHSRPRLFIVGLRRETPIPDNLQCSSPAEPWHSVALQRAFREFGPNLRRQFVWWRLPVPRHPVRPLAELIEKQPEGVRWNSPEETARLLGLMSDINLRKLKAAQATGKRLIGTVYKRIRADENGEKIQRAELRLDGIAGCLRTPVGGSSRQTILMIERNRIESRLLAPREAARLMGVRDGYPLPERYNDAYHLFGDGVAVPVANWLSKHLLLPLVSGQKRVATARRGVEAHYIGQQLDFTSITHVQGK